MRKGMVGEKKGKKNSLWGANSQTWLIGGKNKKWSARSKRK